MEGCRKCDGPSKDEHKTHDGQTEAEKHCEIARAIARMQYVHNAMFSSVISLHRSRSRSTPFKCIIYYKQ